jgi:ABC-type lipoprotein release transport system permease subunit
MSASWLWAQADLRRRWTSAVLLALLVAVPVGAALALAAGALRAGDSIDHFVTATDLGDVVVFFEGPADFADALGADPRIASVHQTTTVAAAPAPIEIGEGGYMLVGGDASSPGGLGRPLLIAGRYPSPGSTDEIMVNERAADEYGFEIGTRTPVEGLVSVESFERVQLGDAVVVGIVRLPFDLVDDPSTDALAVAGPDFGGGSLANAAGIGTVLWLRLHDPADVPSVISELSRRVERGDVETTGTLVEGAQRAVELQRNGLLITAGVVAAAALVAVGQALGRHLAPRREDSHVLAAIGLTPAARRCAGLLAIAPAAITGVLVGVPIAVVASPLFPLGLARRADPVHGLRADWQVLLCGVVVALAAVWTCAVFVVRRWAQPRVDEGAQRAATVARISEAVGLRPVPSAGAHLALAGGRGRARLPVLPVLAALIAVVAIVVGSLVVRSSLQGLTGDAERYGQPWDVAVAADALEQRDVGRVIASDPRVAGVEAMHNGEVDLRGADGTIRQVGATGLEGLSGPMWLAVLDGRAPAGPGEIAIGTATMRSLGLSIGDVTTVSSPCGERRVEVVGRAIVPLLNGDDPDSGSVLQLTTFDELCAGRLLAEIDEAVGVMVRLRDDGDASSFVDDQMAEGRWAEAIGPVPSSVTMLGDVRQVPIVLVAAIGLLGLMAAAHAMLLAVRRRGGDLAALRAIGMRPVDVRRVVGWQAIAMGAVTVAVGVPLGLVLGRVAWTAISRPANVLVHVVVEPLAVAGVALSSVVLLLGVAIWPGRRAARLRLSEALRSE